MAYLILCRINNSEYFLADLFPTVWSNDQREAIEYDSAPEAIVMIRDLCRKKKTAGRKEQILDPKQFLVVWSDYKKKGEVETPPETLKNCIR